jgi:hypothetical protein
MVVDSFQLLLRLPGMASAVFVTHTSVPVCLFPLLSSAPPPFAGYGFQAGSHAWHSRKSLKALILIDFARWQDVKRGGPVSTFFDG